MTYQARSEREAYAGARIAISSLGDGAVPEPLDQLGSAVVLSTGDGGKGRGTDRWTRPDFVAVLEPRRLGPATYVALPEIIGFEVKMLDRLERPNVFEALSQRRGFTWSYLIIDRQGRERNRRRKGHARGPEQALEEVLAEASRYGVGVIIAQDLVDEPRSTSVELAAHAVWPAPDDLQDFFVHQVLAAARREGRLDELAAHRLA